MKSIKLIAVIFALSLVLTFSSPILMGASRSLEMPPAVVLVQDRNNSMLANHNFKFDDGMLVPGDDDIDTGFYVKVDPTH